MSACPYCAPGRMNRLDIAEEHLISALRWYTGDESTKMEIQLALRLISKEIAQRKCDALGIHPETECAT